jgi:hypothetical protein
MWLHHAQREAGAPHTLEWKWRPSFVCDTDRTHFEVLNENQERVILREHSRRQKEARE